MVQCSACGNHVWVESACRERVCPDCFRLWGWDETYKAAARLTLGARYYSIHYRARHVIVSPPQGPLPGSREELADLRRRAQDVLKTMGFWGGSMVFHPWRKRCEECGGPLGCTGRVCHSGAGTVWIGGPHFHVVGYGAVNAEDREDGWVVKTKERRKSVVGTLFYLLTHAGISYRSHALTWFGWWGYRALGEKELLRTINGASIPPKGESKCTSFQAWIDAQREVASPWRCSKCGGTMEPVPADSIHRFGWDRVLEIGGDDG